MSSRCTKAVRSVQIAAFVLGAGLTLRAEAAPNVLNVCLDQTNPTATMDARVATAAAKAQGYAVHKIYFIGHGKLASDGFPIKRFAQLANTKCDLIMGFPVDVDQPQLPPHVQATPAYASTGFGIVGAGAKAPQALDSMPKGTQVGIAHLDTWAGLLFRTHKQIVMNVFPSDDEMLKSVEKHKIDDGLIWQPFLEGYEHKHSGAKALRYRPLDGKHMVWDLVALYANATPAEMTADVFVKGLAALRAQGKLEKLVSPYRVPRDTSDKSARNAPTDSVLKTATAKPARGHLIQVADKPEAKAQLKADAKSKAKSFKKPALYTEKQATDGFVAYAKNCAMCHGPQLMGQWGGFPGPQLKGAAFADPSYAFTVGQMFGFVSKGMPAYNPGSLTNKEYVEIMAFLLKANKYPAGDTPLTYEGATASKVPMVDTTEY